MESVLEQKRGRLKGEKSHAKLTKTEHGLVVMRHGQFVACWPRYRVWEPHDGKWRSRELDQKNAKPHDVVRFSVWEPLGNGRRLVWRSGEPDKTIRERQRLALIREAMRGSPEELEKRLVACSESLSRDANIHKRELDLTCKAENPQSGIVGSSLFLVPRSEENGRPPTPPAYPQVGTTYDVARLELATSRLTRYAYRLLAADAVAKSDVEAAAQEMGLTRPEIRELCGEFYNPQPRREPLYRNLIGTREFRELETPEHEAQRAIVRANRLFYLGVPDRFIAKRIGVTLQQLKRWRIPQHRIGACQSCVSYHRKNPVMPVHYCGHYDVAFRFEGNRARRTLMDAAQFLAELRRISPKTTGKLPCWGNSGWSRISIARWLRTAPHGRSTHEGDFGNIMCVASGHKSFVADQSLIWSQGVRIWRNGRDGSETEELDTRHRPVPVG